MVTPKQTFAAIIMLHKNTKVEVCSPDGDRDIFVSIVRILQGDTLASYFFIFYLDYVLRTSINLIKEKGFTLKNARIRRYVAENITDADYTDDIRDGKGESGKSVLATRLYDDDDDIYEYTLYTYIIYTHYIYIHYMYIYIYTHYIYIYIYALYI